MLSVIYSWAFISYLYSSCEITNKSKHYFLNLRELVWNISRMSWSYVLRERVRLFTLIETSIQLLIKKREQAYLVLLWNVHSMIIRAHRCEICIKIPTTTMRMKKWKRLNNESNQKRKKECNTVIRWMR